MNKFNNEEIKVFFNKLIGKENVEEIISEEEDNLNNQNIEKICDNILEYENNSNVLEKNVIIDLEILEGLGLDKQETIFKYIDNTHTYLGRNLLKKIIQFPTNNLKILGYRQQFIKKILNKKNDEKIKLENLLSNIKLKEKNIFWLWKDMNDETKTLFNMVYFQRRILKFLNKNELAMKLYNYYIIIFSPLYGILSPILMVLAPFIFIKFYFKTDVNLSLYFKLFKVAMSGFGNMKKVNMNDNSAISWSQIISILVWLVFYIHGLFSNIQMAINTNKITNIIHTKLNNISNYMKNGYELDEIISKDLNEITKFINYEEINKNEIFYKKIFETEPSFYTNKGIILKTYKILEEKKNNLRNILKSIANFDCFYSIAKLYENNSNDYCFPQFKENDKPIVHLEQSWYPILKNRAIKNNIKLGDMYRNNALVTGPNAGGKSTFIKSVAINIIFAQTLTISPGKSLTLTPFSLINTYLNIPDCKGKESLFEAEMRRSLEYINKLKKMKNKEFSFVIMDEIFSSTNPEEGISGAYAIAEEISNNPRNISIITSHYSYLSNLEKTKRFTNYKIPIVKNKKGEIKYTYKIQEGVSNQFIALELLKKKGFDQKLVEKAQKICSKLSNDKKYVTCENVKNKELKEKSETIFKKKIPKKKKFEKKKSEN